MGKNKRREGVGLHLFLQLTVTDAIALCPSQLRQAYLDTSPLETTHIEQRITQSELHYNALSPGLPLSLQSPLRKIYISKHILIKNELQLDVNHIQIGVSKIRGKNEITYAKTQIVHNLSPHMRNTILRCMLQDSFEEDSFTISF